MKKIEELFQPIMEQLSKMSIEDKINTINQIKKWLHQYSPFADEPIDCVLWVKAQKIQANEYNPNAMAPIEKRLLSTSLNQDGFTQPIVVYAHNNRYTIVDGFHRYMLGKGKKSINTRLKNYLPITCIKDTQKEKPDRIAATIRHNRARGKHQIMAMSDIVQDLARLGWEDKKIAKELGMDLDEVLRLKQISGLAEMFEGDAFSEAWTVR
ncbi:IbrB-like domain-containing protein [Neisseria sp. Ec49-e6-T10]|uniref:IbrB-like domain-containing protein n=1 Tax=Neisseria sp. Ec49-e6-T10 TaxID=3140744 RepID=UPI003EBBEA04